jgi:hypothetical protein
VASRAPSLTGGGSIAVHERHTPPSHATPPPTHISTPQASKSDALFQKRWEALLAVDDAVAAVVAAAEAAASRPTYFLLTSDHGFQARCRAPLVLLFGFI